MDDMKFLIWFVAIVVGGPLFGMAMSEYHQYNCKVQLAKVGRTAEDIANICK